MQQLLLLLLLCGGDCDCGRCAVCCSEGPTGGRRLCRGCVGVGDVSTPVLPFLSVLLLLCVDQANSIALTWLQYKQHTSDML